MKKVLSVVLSLALLACVAVVPASAAMSDDLLGSATFTSLISFDEEVFEVGAISKDVEYAGLDPHNYEASIVATGGESGQAYHWVADGTTSNPGANPMSFGGIDFYLDALDVSGDLSEQDELVFWIDLSEAGTETQAGIMLMFGSDNRYGYPPTGQGIYIEDGEGGWEAFTTSYAGWGRITMPVNYKGWMRISLDAASWQIGDNYKNTANPTFDLENVVGLFVGIDCKSSGLNKPVVIDSIGVLKGDVNTPKPTTTDDETDVTTGDETDVTTGDKDDATTTAPAKATTTKAQGATTGEAAPVAAAIAVVLAAGAVIALRKRAK